MPWYNGKFFYERDNINLRTSQRFDALPTQNNLLDDLLVFNNTTNEVNSRTVASLGAVGPTGATGVRGLDGNSSLWEFKDFITGQPGAGEFRFDGGNTFGDGELYINVIDNLGNDMTNWLQNFAYGDILVLRSYDSYNEFAIYQIKDSGFTSTINGNIITIPLTVAGVTNPANELIDAFGSGVSGQGGSFAVNSLCTIGYVKGGIKGLAGNSSIWVYTNSGPNLPTLPSTRFTIGANAPSWNPGLGIHLYINFTDEFQTNMNTWLTSINVGDIIYIREYISNFTNFVYYKVDSIALNVTYIDFSVTHIESNNVGTGVNWNNNKFDIGFIPAGAQGAQGATGSTGATGATGSTGAIGVRGLDGNSSLWKHVDGSNYPSPGTGNFCLDGGNTYGDGDIVISRTDNFGTDMTNWLQNIEIGDIVTFRNYNSYEYFAIYVVSVSPTTQTNTVTLAPAVPPDLLDAYGLPATAGQNGAFEVNALYTIGYVKRGLQGPTGDTLNSSNWLWGSSNLSAFTSGQFTSFASGSSSNSLSNTTTIEINPVDRNGNIIGTGPSTSVGTYIATGWFGLFNTGDVLTVQYSENNYATYRLTKQPEWVVSSFPGNPAIIRLSVEFVNNGSASSTFTILEYGIGLVNGGMNAGLDYNFDEVTIPPSGSPISFGSIRLNNTTQNTSTEAYLSVEVANGNSVGTFINSWNSFGNNPGTRGFLQFKTNHNDDFLTFDVTNVSFTTTGGPHYIIQLTNGIGAIGTPYINNELVSVNFIPAGAQGPTGATGAQGPAGPGSAVSNGTISFWSELGGEIGGTRAGPTAPMPLILAGPSGGPQQEIWPILPHGGGAFRDTWGTYIGGEGLGNRTPNTQPATHGEYMPFDGKVYAYGINFDNYSGAISLPPVSYDIFVMNYTTGDIQLTTTVTGGPSSVSVIAGAGVPSLGFIAGDHIGLAVKYDGNLRCYMAVEGTIYFEYSYP